jgi:hypothetical protein
LNRISEYLEITDRKTGKRDVCCSKCGYILGPLSKGIYSGAVTRNMIPNEISPVYTKTDQTLFRLYSCPGCATQLKVEPIVKEAPRPPQLPEIEL